MVSSTVFEQIGKFLYFRCSIANYSGHRRRRRVLRSGVGGAYATRARMALADVCATGKYEISSWGP